MYIMIEQSDDPDNLGLMSQRVRFIGENEEILKGYANSNTNLNKDLVI